MAYKFQRGEAILSGALLQEGNVEIEQGFQLIIGNAKLTEAELEQIDGVTAGTVAASKAVVVDANKDADGFRNMSGSTLLEFGSATFLGGSVTAGTSFIIGSADLNETDLEKLDGITNGTVAASKAVVVDSNKDASGFRALSGSGALTMGSLAGTSLALQGGGISSAGAIAGADSIDGTGDLTMGTITMTGFSVDADGDTALKSLAVDNSSTIGCDADTDIMTLANQSLALANDVDFNVAKAGGLQIGGVAVTSTAAELNLVDGITAGTVAASKAVIVDSNKDISGFRNVTATGYFEIGSAQLVEADMELIDDLTAGTVVASKAVTVDANKDVSGLRNVTATGAFIIGSANMDETDLEKLDGITNGTVAASKAVVVDAQKAAAGFSKLTISGSGDHLVLGSGTDRTLSVVIDGSDDFFVMGHDAGAVTLSASAGVEFVGGDEGVGSFGSDIKVYDDQNGTNTMVALSNAGVISGSSKLEIGGTVRLDGAADAALDVAADSFYFFDATNQLMKRDRMSDYATAIAGDGLGASSGVLAVQVHGNGGLEVASDALMLNIDGMDALGGASIAQGDEFPFSDGTTPKKVTFSNLEDSIFANLSGDIAVAAGGLVSIAAEAVHADMLNDDVISGQTELAADGLAAADELLISDGGTLKKIGVDNLFLDGPALLGEEAVAVGSDYIMFLDGGATGDAKKESIADLVSAMAGAGLSAASGVLAVQGNSVALKANGDTLAEGYNYFANIGASDAVAAVQLPAAPSVGDVVTAKAGDLADDKYVRISAQGSHTIDGATSIDLESPFAAVTLVYVATNDWRIV